MTKHDWIETTLGWIDKTFVDAPIAEFRKDLTSMSKQEIQYCFFTLQIEEMSPREKVRRLRDITMNFIDKDIVTMPEGYTREQYSITFLHEAAKMPQEEIAKVLLTAMLAEQKGKEQ